MDTSTIASDKAAETKVKSVAIGLVPIDGAISMAKTFLKTARKNFP